MITNRSNEHLSSLDRDRDHADKNDPSGYAHDREQDHNKIQEFISIDNTITENGLKMSTESENVRNNMYLTSDFDIKRDRNSASLRLSSGITSCPRESKRHMLDYAMNVEPWSKRNFTQTRRKSSDNIQNLPSRERSSSTSSQSDYFQNLYKKYPQAFQYRAPNNRGHRPSRQLFNSGLRVHFEDDSFSIGDACSVTSERPMSKYDKEIEEMLGSKMDFNRDCITSPTPSMVSDSSTKERLHATSESLRRLLQHRKYHRSKLANDLEQKLKRSSIASDISETDSNLDPLSALEKELEHREQMLKSMNKRNKRIDHNQNERHIQSSQLRIYSSDSTPDSAIDIDTASVQSGGSTDRRTKYVLDPRLKGHDVQLPSEFNRIKEELFPRKPVKILVRKGVVHKDSDVDSGIVPTSVSDDTPIEPPSYKHAVSTRTDMGSASYTRQADKPGHGSRPSPIKADHSLMLNLMLNQSFPTDEDDSIAQEIITAQMSRDLEVLPQRHRPGSHVHFEDEVDDSDPRLGIPSMTGEEKKIAERYHRRRSPMPFVINRTCVTSRNEKSKTNSENRQSRSDNRVSVLCTPRDRGLDSHLTSAEFKHVNGAMNGDILKAESQQVLYPEKHANLRPQEKYSSCFSSQPNLFIESKHSPLDKQIMTGNLNGYSNIQPSVNLQPRHEPKSSLNLDSQIHKNYNEQYYGAIEFQGSKPLSKSQPNLAPTIESSTKGRQSVSRTSSSNSDHSSHTLVSSQMNLNGEVKNDVNHNVPFTARNTRKKLHLKKYFKAKKGKYNPSLEENCFGGDLGHGTSMPDLSGKITDKTVQYSQVSKPRSMQNIYFSSKDLDSDSDEEDSRPKFKSEFLPNFGAISKNKEHVTNFDSFSDRDSGVEAKTLKNHRGQRSKDSCSSSGSNHDVRQQKYAKNVYQQPKRVESDSSSQSCLSSETENLQRGQIKSQLTPYESSVLHLDKQGVDVNDLIESDSDSFSAKCVVVNKAVARKNIYVVPSTSTKVESPIERLPESNSQQHERRYKKKGDNLQPTTKNVTSVQNDRKCSDKQELQHVPPITCHDSQDMFAINSISSSVSSMSSQDQISFSSDQNRKDSNESSKGDNSDRTFIVEGKSPPIVHVSSDSQGHDVKQNEEKKEITETCVKNKESVDIPTHVYAEVHFGKNKKKNEEAKEGRQLDNKLSASTPNIAANFDPSIDIEIDENPPVPDMLDNRETNLVKTKELSSSKQSLSGKMGSIKKSAKNKFKALRKAVSMDKGIDGIGAEGQPKVKDKKKSKEKKGFFGLFSKKKSKQKAEKTSESGDSNPSEEHFPMTSDLQSKWTSCNSIDSVNDEQRIGNQLNKINTDGTQIITLYKSSNKSIDFFISRGSAQFKHGIFVSRFIDNKTNKYSGLLSVGDELLEVNGFKVQDLLLDDVYSLLSNSEKLVMTILPLLARQDV